MTNAINWMVFLSEGKKYYSAKTKSDHKLYLNFITLTLCAEQFHSDEHVKRHMLEPFLKWLKRSGAELYVWRAETQANGNIHFHITSNKFIHWRSIRNKWNNILQKHGYLKKFLDKHGHSDPNSTDVKGVRNPHKMAAYMVKYMSKSDITRRPVTCKVWSCSTALMNKRMSIDQLDIGFDNIRDFMHSHCDLKQIEGVTLMKYKSKDIRAKAMQLYNSSKSISDVTLLHAKTAS